MLNAVIGIAVISMLSFQAYHYAKFTNQYFTSKNKNNTINNNKPF